jgi:hypothetical protein
VTLQIRPLAVLSSTYLLHPGIAAAAAAYIVDRRAARASVKWPYMPILIDSYVRA